MNKKSVCHCIVAHWMKPNCISRFEVPTFYMSSIRLRTSLSENSCKKCRAGWRAGGHGVLCSSREGLGLPLRTAHTMAVCLFAWSLLPQETLGWGTVTHEGELCRCRGRCGMASSCTGSTSVNLLWGAGWAEASNVTNVVFFFLFFFCLFAVSRPCGGGGVSRHAYLWRCSEEAEDGRCLLHRALLSTSCFSEARTCPLLPSSSSISSYSVLFRTVCVFASSAPTPFPFLPSGISVSFSWPKSMQLLRA